MSQENVEIVRRVYEAVARGDADSVLALYDEEAVYDFSGSPFRTVMNQLEYRGHDGLRKCAGERLEIWGDLEDELEELLDPGGDQVITVVKSHGRGKKSGIEIGRTHVGLWTIQDGRVVRVEWFGTRKQALEAAAAATG